jgi:hypothetical protein
MIKEKYKEQVENDKRRREGKLRKSKNCHSNEERNLNR